MNAVSKVLMILMTRSYLSNWSDISDIPRHVNIPLLSPNYTLHTLHSTSPIRSDHTDRTIQLTSFMTILRVIRLHLHLHFWLLLIHDIHMIYTLMSKLCSPVQRVPVESIEGGDGFSVSFCQGQGVR